MSNADERARAFTAAVTDFEKALRWAEKVTDAWYRSQSLAAVARFAPDGEVIRVADKSLEAAKLTENAYKRTAVSAWAIRALAERNKVHIAQQRIRSLLSEAETIEHPVSKIDALSLLWQAAWLLPPVVKKPVTDALLAACQAANSWKAGRTMGYTALVVAKEDKRQAQHIIDSMRDGIYKRQAQKRLNARQTAVVRDFF